MSTVEYCYLPTVDGGEALVPNKLPLPGVVIFVHGVNSDGEWYDAAEEGLCAGLNERLARQNEQMCGRGSEVGQLMPTQYSRELTNDGFISRTRNDQTFITPAESYSNVIRFRWGYKASKDEVKEFGPNVWLNEHDYWGGGPFANGCSTIADLWGEGLNDRLFLWITAQHLNPVPGRDAYACPPRAYCVHAALRLAKLIKSIRDKQADCPITVICHSQGNMVGIAAAFLADKLEVQADNFILVNPPLSLVSRDAVDSWFQRTSRDAEGNIGRQTERARYTTLKNFFGLLRERAGLEQNAEYVNAWMGNTRKQGVSEGYSPQVDRATHGHKGSTYGRVTLYCCPHDQVVSAATVQGIGWRGMSVDEIKATDGEFGVFTQRVFAQGHEVGQAPGPMYHYWDHRWNKNAASSQDGFWHPPSPVAQYSLQQGLESSKTGVGKIMTLVSWPFLVLIPLAGIRIHAEPKKGWQIPITAPKLPIPFKPRARRYGVETEQFDERFDPAANARNSKKGDEAKDERDPYDNRKVKHTEDRSMSDAPLGDDVSEAQLRYEDRARLRMKARRAGKAEEDGTVLGEDQPYLATLAYNEWRAEQITSFLDQGVDQSATDHSTIVTHPDHAKRAIAYDVAIGVCTLTPEEWHSLRVEADWRYLSALRRDGHPHAELGRYFSTGLMGKKLPLQEWVKTGEAAMPERVIDERSWKQGDGLSDEKSQIEQDRGQRGN